MSSYIVTGTNIEDAVLTRSTFLIRYVVGLEDRVEELEALIERVSLVQ